MQKSMHIFMTLNLNISGVFRSYMTCEAMQNRNCVAAKTHEFILKLNYLFSVEDRSTHEIFTKRFVCTIYYQKVLCSVFENKEENQLPKENQDWKTQNLQRFARNQHYLEVLKNGFGRDCY